jgi:hypothetical protein
MDGHLHIGVVTDHVRIQSKRKQKQQHVAGHSIRKSHPVHVFIAENLLSLRLTLLVPINSEFLETKI